MKRSITWLTGCAVFAFAGIAQADCAEDLARLTGDAGMATEASTTAAPEAGTTEGIAKDGSLAPLETPDADPAATAAAAGEASAEGTAESTNGSAAAAADGDIAKDGSLAPLEQTDAEPGTEVAMSGQDVQAQQEGEPTASERAEAATPEGDRDGLVEEARTALAAGDEEACLAAIEKIEAQ
ncbi:hypothetical protein PANO111632_04645 [Paracoccus nototheniae]|uniref:Uncharacterized protein n=1 Tax=Paracoccus nototheniae TaxID=2489002 RepID=A0ABW4DUE5_9RHOB|nr:hypothetical protein [Paracoccus nototheniae]